MFLSSSVAVFPCGAGTACVGLQCDYSVDLSVHTELRIITSVGCRQPAPSAHLQAWLSSVESSTSPWVFSSSPRSSQVSNNLGAQNILFTWKYLKWTAGVSVSTSLENGIFNYQLARAPLIIGVRRPDDVTDRILHRNGKFINNQFVPADNTVSIAVNEEKK